MMDRNYTYFSEFDADDNLLWHVYEIATEQIIRSFIFDDDAEDYCMFLENGGSFDGFTPSFVLHKSYKGNINEAFDAEFSE